LLAFNIFAVILDNQIIKVSDKFTQLDCVASKIDNLQFVHAATFNFCLICSSLEMDGSSSSDEDGNEAVSFDSYNTQLYLFDNMDRKGAEELLRVSDVGTFLIRRSVTKSNSYSLSVR
jgi:hypothetical protein